MNMELEQQWKSMGTAEDTHVMMDFSIPANAEHKKTASPLYKIRKALEIGMCWIVVALLIYVAGVILFKPLFTKLSLLILAGYSVYSFIQSLKLYKQIDPMVLASNSVKAELDRHYNSITRWCKTQERNAIFLYPVALLGGAMLGLSSVGAQKMSHVLQKPVVWMAFGGIAIVLAPLFYYGTRRMIKAAYHSHLQHLKQLINSLED